MNPNQEENKDLIKKEILIDKIKIHRPKAKGLKAKIIDKPIDTTKIDK